MEFLIITVIGLAVVYFIFKRTGPSALEILDTNKDGKVDKEEIKAAADVNKDGRIDVKDVKAAVKKTTSAVKTRTQKKTKANGTRSQRKV